MLSRIDPTGELFLTSAGTIVRDVWDALPDRFPAVRPRLSW
jgi:hypothetical protein